MFSGRARRPFPTSSAVLCRGRALSLPVSPNGTTSTGIGHMLEARVLCFPGGHGGPPLQVVAVLCRGRALSLPVNHAADLGVFRAGTEAGPCK